MEFSSEGNATGIDGNQADNSAPNSGAVYLFVRDGQGMWSQQAYVKASNAEAHDRFGNGLALSALAATSSAMRFSNPGRSISTDATQPDRIVWCLTALLHCLVITRCWSACMVYR